MISRIAWHYTSRRLRFRHLYNLQSREQHLLGCMDVILSGLNTAQSAAVTSPAAVLQVLAPPGSGKTKTLTARVAHLLIHHGYRPWNVICCTFTIKASREMRSRLKALIGDSLESKLLLGTFHSICRRYLANYGYLIGIPKGFGIADSSDSLTILTVWRYSIFPSAGTDRRSW
jgi:DNA helicase II / ATP-dependent DNA helicase PcrA